MSNSGERGSGVTNGGRKGGAIAPRCSERGAQNRLAKIFYD